MRWRGRELIPELDEVLAELLERIMLGLLVISVPIWGPFWIVGWASRAIYRLVFRYRSPTEADQGRK